MVMAGIDLHISLPLTRKERLPKCQEIPIYSAGGKKHLCFFPWWMQLLKKNPNLDLHSKMAEFVLLVL